MHGQWSQHKHFENFQQYKFPEISKKDKFALISENVRIEQNGCKFGIACTVNDQKIISKNFKKVTNLKNK